MRIHIYKWRHRVNYPCRHAMYHAGIRTVRNLAETKIVDLLRLAETDANDVATIMTVVLESNREELHPNYGMSKLELAEAVNDLCENNNLDHKKLLEITVEGMLNIEGLDQATIPPIIRNIKHIMLGKPDPAELLKIPPESKKKGGNLGTWWQDPEEISWEEEIAEEFKAASSYDRQDDIAPYHPRRYPGYPGYSVIV